MKLRLLIIVLLCLPALAQEDSGESIVANVRPMPCSAPERAGDRCLQVRWSSKFTVHASHREGYRASSRLVPSMQVVYPPLMYPEGTQPGKLITTEYPAEVLEHDYVSEVLPARPKKKLSSEQTAKYATLRKKLLPLVTSDLPQIEIVDGARLTPRLTKPRLELKYADGPTQRATLLIPLDLPGSEQSQAVRAALHYFIEQRLTEVGAYNEMTQWLEISKRLRTTQLNCKDAVRPRRAEKLCTVDLGAVGAERETLATLKTHRLMDRTLRAFEGVGAGYGCLDVTLGSGLKRVQFVDPEIETASETLGEVAEGEEVAQDSDALQCVEPGLNCTRNGERVGKWKEWCEEYGCHEGKYKKGKRVGKWKLGCTEYGCSEGEIKDGFRVGKWKEQCDEYGCDEGEYKDGEQVGIWQICDISGCYQENFGSP